ncbi:MAG TPA: SET domain-containing protein-lysine N-methyltransferase [Candidatus Brocadiaceae bacterium]
MKGLAASKKIFVAKSKIPDSGRGVFAKVNIKKGGLIEKCPIVEIPEQDTALLNESILVTYFFYFGTKKEKAAVALGFGSIYNHTRTPNAVYKIKEKEGVIDFIALKDIKKDDEITVDYNYANPEDKNPLWFEA